ATPIAIAHQRPAGMRPIAASTRVGAPGWMGRTAVSAAAVKSPIATQNAIWMVLIRFTCKQTRGEKARSARRRERLLAGSAHAPAAGSRAAGRGGAGPDDAAGARMHCACDRVRRHG